MTEPEIEKHLVWLVSTGHVVAFTNGVYSAVEKYPKYGPQWQKRREKAVAEEKAVVEEKAVEEEKKEETKDETPAQLA